MLPSHAAPEVVTLNVLQLGCSILLVIVALVALGQLRRWSKNRGLRRRWSVARAAELEAPALLLEQGYRVLDSQVAGSYSLVVDGKPHLVSLRADYLVTRDGLTYVAEVKSGRKAPRFDTAATRRQLLEYSIAYAVDGVLLVDGLAHRVERVEFPQRLRQLRTDGLAFVAVAAVLLVVAIALGLYLFGQ